LTYSDKKWANSCRISVKKLKTFITFASNPENFPKNKSLFSIEITKNKITIDCPNILKYRDEYSRKKSKSQENVLTMSGQTPDKVAPSRARVTDTETEADGQSPVTETEKTPPLPPSFENPETDENENPSPEAALEISGEISGEKSSSSNPKDPEKPKKQSIPYQQIYEAYREHCPELPCIRKLTEGLRKDIQARWKQDSDRQSLTWWVEYFCEVAKSDFLMGRKTDWKANFKWLVGKRNMDKVEAGFYSNHAPQHEELTPEYHEYLN
jgi:hypothetical protein